MSLRCSAQFTLQLRHAYPRLFLVSFLPAYRTAAGLILPLLCDAVPPGLSRAVCLR
jgi:hypothetical protein